MEKVVISYVLGESVKLEHNENELETLLEEN